jgi:hypothetical protein
MNHRTDHCNSATVCYCCEFLKTVEVFLLWKTVEKKVARLRKQWLWIVGRVGRETISWGENPRQGIPERTERPGGALQPVPGLSAGPPDGISRPRDPTDVT